MSEWLKMTLFAIHADINLSRDFAASA